MKKILCITLALMMLLSLAACGNQTVATGTTAETSAAAEDNAADVTEAAQKSADGIDIDLTAMSSTMVYSEVQNMMMNPGDYVGKTVKMRGAFNVAEIENNRYFACIIKDATACCSQGIEFEWKGDHAYPDDYPEIGTDLTVIGTFNTYMEGIQTYCQLKDAELSY